MPFGVELPENFGSEASPETKSPDASPSPSSGTEIHVPKEAKEPESKPIELDSLQSFRFKGRDLSPKELESLLEGQDSSRQDGNGGNSKADFDANYAADVAAVKLDPSRLGDFAAIYPREYVIRAIHEMRKAEAQKDPASRSIESDDPHAARFERYDRMVASFEQAQKEHRLATIGKTLETWHGSLATKYPDADPIVVDGKAIVASERGIQVTEKILEKLYKQDHEQRSKYYEQKYRRKAEEQITANKRGRDIPPGGMPVGMGAHQPKTIKEATALALETLKSARA